MKLESPSLEEVMQSATNPKECECQFRFGPRVGCSDCGGSFCEICEGAHLDAKCLVEACPCGNDLAPVRTCEFCGSRCCPDCSDFHANRECRPLPEDSKDEIASVLHQVATGEEAA
jgi:hypothetical protein